MTTQNKKVIEKVKKLLSLATSPNVNESKLASAKAMELLTEHNISMGEVEDSEFNNSEYDTGKSYTPVEYNYVGDLLKRYFFVELVYTKKYDMMGKTKQYIHFLGESTNVEIGIYMFEYLNRIIDNGWKEYCKENYTRSGSKQSYIAGFHTEMRRKFEAMTTKHCTGTEGLVLTKNKLKRFVYSEFNNLTKGSGGGRYQGDGRAANTGAEHGKNTTIHMGVNGSSNNSGRYLS